MPLDSFLSFAEGDIENFCRIDCDLIHQKFRSDFVQIVHLGEYSVAKPQTAVLRIFFYFL